MLTLIHDVQNLLFHCVILHTETLVHVWWMLQAPAAGGAGVPKGDNCR